MPEAPPAPPVTEPEVEPDAPAREAPAPSPFEPDWPDDRPLPPPKARLRIDSPRS